MRCVEEVSADGTRKVIIKEVSAITTNCVFYEVRNLNNKNYFYPLLEFTVDLSIDELDEEERCVNLAKTYLQVGIYDIFIYDIFKKLACYCYSDCPITIYIQENISIELKYDYTFGLDIIDDYGDIYSKNDAMYKLKELTIKDLKQDFFGIVERYDLIPNILGVSLSENKDSLGQFTYNGVTFLGYNYVLDKINKATYLRDIGFFSINTLFKENAFTDNDDVFFTKVKVLKKKVLIKHIKNDFSVEYELV